ncbi:MAG: T9SS type B sorting domain-containing protein [Bacteroidia bacterium]
MRGFVRFLSVLVCTISWGAYAQISDFSLTVDKTEETCQGNGTLTFSVSNTSANAQIIYKIFKLPNITNAMSVQTSGYIGGLTAGTYKVVAIQSLNAESNTKEKQVTINNAMVAFNFNITTQFANCAGGGTLVLAATSGTLSACEIIAGPVSRPRQSGNTFSNLPTGTYTVRAYNECGIARVKQYTINVVSASLSIGDTEYVQNNSTVCDSIQISNTISSSSGPVNYPVTVRHTLSPMDLSGQNLIVDQTITTGDTGSFAVTARVPRFVSQSYTYDLTVVDNCGSLYSKNGNIVDPNITLALSEGEAICARKFIKLSALKFTGSYTVTFVSAPAGFVAADYQATPQGPFTTESVNFGGETNPVPFGTYEILITDSCGRTATATIELIFKMPKPAYTPYNNGCFSNFGGINVTVPPQKIVTATITAAPASYTQNHTLPENVSAFISNGMVRLVNLPKGSYTVAITDDCGFSYPPTAVVIPDYVDKGFNIAALPACVPGFGGVRFRTGNVGGLTSAKIVTAPSAFAHSLPYSLSGSFTADGQVYVSDLPQGDYVFEGIDRCGTIVKLPITVKGYDKPVTPYNYEPSCGTFAVTVKDDSIALEGASYWLQKFFPATNSWGHPQNGAAYTEDTVPTTANAIRLTNLTERNNLAYSGKFRIIKKFETYTNGSAQNTMCISQYGNTFEYYEGLSINAVYTMACAGAPRDIVIDYTGTATAFRIAKKNGQTFVVNNGNSNTFLNLEPAEYVFEIEDSCGNILPQWYQSADLPSMGDAQDPTDLVECVDEGGNAVSSVGRSFRIRDKDPEILGPLYASMYIITYHNTVADAANAVNPLPDYVTSSQNGQEIFVRMQHRQISICHKITSFRLYSGQNQKPAIETTGVICNDGVVALTAPDGYDAYIWSTGERTQTIYAAEAGKYTVEVHKTYGTSFCKGTAEAEVTKSTTAKITEIELADWTFDKNSVTVHAEGQGDYEYAINGGEFSTNNVFDGLESGIYNVFVKDTNGCGVTSQEVVLLNYPKFFTPNGDGQNDKWKIKYSFKEPDFHVTIFDRYGKLITTLPSSSDGWDGTLNGIQLPSTDYWFVVNREDGRELRGHFSMVR